VRFDELRRLLEAYGWQLTRVSGSHHVFERGSDIFPVPRHGRSVKAVYVRRALQLTAGEEDTSEGD
jgi:predicted RNA binding protein YcfA (HicA-like mRNA interferase family)